MLYMPGRQIEPAGMEDIRKGVRAPMSVRPEVRRREAELMRMTIEGGVASRRTETGFRVRPITKTAYMC